MLGVENACQIKLNNVKFNDFRLCYCGYEECEPGHSFGPAVKNHYVLHYVLSGKGEFSVNNQHYTISKGEAFLIEPNVRAYYKADEETPWTYLWVGFDGDHAEEYLREMKG